MLANSREITNERGATLLEAVMVLIILVSVLFTSFDVMRYFAVAAVLNKGAQDGLTMAAEIKETDIDVWGLDLSKPEDIDKYNRFKAARNKVITEALRLPLATLMGPYHSGYKVQLQQVKMIDGFSDVSTQDVMGDVAVLRPGDSATIEGFDGNWRWEHNPCRCLASTVNNDCVNKRQVNQESLSRLMQSCPIVISLHATLEPITPGLSSLLPQLTVEGRAAGWREIVPKSGMREPLPYVNVPVTSSSSGSTSSGSGSSSSGGSTSSAPPPAPTYEASSICTSMCGSPRTDLQIFEGTQYCASNSGPGTDLKCDTSSQCYCTSGFGVN